MTDKTKTAAKANATDGSAKTKGEGEGTRAVSAPKTAPAAHRSSPWPRLPKRLRSGS